MEPSQFRAKTAAKLHLHRLWKRSQAGSATDPIQFIRDAPAQVAVGLLGFQVVTPPFFPGQDGVAGFIDRGSKTIGVISKGSLGAHRFTLAHEIGHVVLHSGESYFRDRSISEPGSGCGRPSYEIEADAFAAELLMPRKLLRNVFNRYFGNFIETGEPDVELAYAVSTSEKQWGAFDFSEAKPIEQAKAIGRARNFKSVRFSSLVDLFQVSPMAMAIQLLETGCVRPRI